MVPKARKLPNPRPLDNQTKNRINHALHASRDDKKCRAGRPQQRTLCDVEQRTLNVNIRVERPTLGVSSKEPQITRIHHVQRIFHFEARSSSRTVPGVLTERADELLLSIVIDRSACCGVASRNRSGPVKVRQVLQISGPATMGWAIRKTTTKGHDKHGARDRPILNIREPSSRKLYDKPLSTPQPVNLKHFLIHTSRPWISIPPTPHLNK